ncbi:MAG: hypothetical protein AAGG51_28245 [Cyanobacteria bacterium P01_G01_bin.54]
MNDLIRKPGGFAKNILATPFILASIILVAVAGFAIGSNYQGEIQLTLNTEGGSLDIKGCKRWRRPYD